MTPSDKPEKDESDSDLSAGAIAGIAVAGASIVVIAALLFFFWRRTKNLKDEVERKAGPAGVLRPGPDGRNPQAMLERGHNHSATMTTNGVGNVYHQYQQRSLLSSPVADPAYQQYNYNQGYKVPPAPSYFIPQIPLHSPLSPPPQQHQQQQQHRYKYEMSRSMSQPPHTLPPIPQQPPLNIHYALAHRRASRAFELSPTGDYARHAPPHHPHETHGPNHNANSNHHMPSDPDTISPAPSHPHDPHRYASPPHGLTATASPEEMIPSYYETVYRPGPKHVNGMGNGPVEMDGRALTGDITPVKTVAAKWEEVEEKAVGVGGA
jgi:hypothetical protein